MQIAAVRHQRPQNLPNGRFGRCAFPALPTAVNAHQSREAGQVNQHTQEDDEGEGIRQAAQKLEPVHHHSQDEGEDHAPHQGHHFLFGGINRALVGIHKGVGP